MEAIIGSSRRITIPKEVFEQMNNAKEGMKVNVTFEDGRFILTPLASTENFVKHKSKYVSTENQTKSQLEKISKEVKTKPKEKTSNFKRQIKSNLSEADKYSRKVFSECGLVIRTKRKYINEFCEDCKGILLDQGYEGNHKCPYKNSSVENSQYVKDVIKQINSNINKLQEDIENNITYLDESLDEDALKFKRQDDTSIFPTKLRKARECEICGKSVTSGFIIDNEEFYCSKCAANDFKNFLEERRKVNE